MQTQWTRLLGVVVVVLAGCGGGGGGSTGGGTTEPPPVDLTLQADCAGADCGADGNRYTGTATGIWVADNTADSRARVEVNITGVTPDTDVTLVITNQSATARSLTDSVTASVLQEPFAATASAVWQQAPIVPRAALGGPPPRQRATTLPRRTWQVGDRKTWRDVLNDGVPKAATLRTQVTLSTGRKLNVWVQDTEFGTGKVTQAAADDYARSFAEAGTGIHDMVTSLYNGQAWGPVGDFPYATIAPDDDMQIVVMDLGRLSGYFAGTNNYAQSVDPASNEALAFFMSASDVYDPTRGMGYARPVLAHEFVHMINFYERFVKHGSYFVDWLEEMSAMGLQELIGNRLNPDDALGWWHAQWLQRGSYNCELTVYSYGSACSSYDVGGSFMLYLMRQYGLSFYRDLVNSYPADNREQAIAQLDRVIRLHDPEAGFAIALRRWGAAAALIDVTRSPARYGYPQRVETVAELDYVLKALNGPNYAAARTLPAGLPPTLQPYAHAPLHIPVTGTSVSRTVILPPHASLTVVVQ